ncbi:MAG TPA: hypothetical protein VFD17_07535 [Clostridia bacterium]|nr:hypothetical protein [Clostridia bacterium]
MNFRTILTFIVIAFISSLLNKNKTSTKPTVKTDRSAPSESPPVDKTPNSVENRRKSFSKELEGLFEEIKIEFDRIHGGGQKEQVHSSVEGAAEEENSSGAKQKLHSSKEAPAKDARRIAGDVYEREIGKEAYIGFDRKSILQGIIMSEILQKPKVLKR